MNKVILIISSLVTSVIVSANEPTEFKSIYAALRQKNKLPQESVQAMDAIYNNKDISISDRLVSQVLTATVLTNQDIDNLTHQSIEICDKVIEKYPHTWQADYLRFIRLIDYGLLGEYKKQIPLAKDALQKIDFNRLNTQDHTFLKICRNDLNISAKRMRDEIHRILGYAYSMSNSFDLAMQEYNKITNTELRNECLVQTELFKDKYIKEKSIFIKKKHKK